MRRLGNNSQQGAVLVFVALLLPMLVFFGGMAIDFGRAYLYKSDLQNAADAAALAGVAAVASTNGQARLIKDNDVPANAVNSADAALKNKAAGAANAILVKDIGINGANDANTTLCTEPQNAENGEQQSNTYYYMVELNDEVRMVFARLFLPDSLLPDGWNIKVVARAWAKATAKINDGKNLDYMTRNAISNEIASNYDEWQKRVGKDASALSFTTNIKYDYENRTRSEVFNMNDSISARKDIFINLRQDIWANSAFEKTWDLSDFRGESYDKINAFFYDLSYNEKKKRVWLTYPENDSTLDLKHITLDQFIRNYAEAVDHITDLNDLTGNDFSKYVNVDKALEMLTSAVKDVINVDEAYPVRQDLDSESKVSFVYNTDEINRQDPLFVRIESEEFNSGNNGRTANSASGGVTNSVRDISININVDNTGNDFRPLVFFYEGPVDADGNRGVGRKSNTVVLNLNADFKGIIYAPNSPVQIKVTGENREFRGYIIAKSLVDEFGNEIATPADEVTTDNAAEFQDFYHNTLNLSEAVYDDFGVVKLNVYKPEKDIFYLTSRARITI